MDARLFALRDPRQSVTPIADGRVRLDTCAGSAGNAQPASAASWPHPGLRRRFGLQEDRQRPGFGDAQTRCAIADRVPVDGVGHQVEVGDVVHGDRPEGANRWSPGEAQPRVNPSCRARTQGASAGSATRFSPATLTLSFLHGTRVEPKSMKFSVASPRPGPIRTEPLLSRHHAGCWAQWGQEVAAGNLSEQWGERSVASGRQAATRVRWPRQSPGANRGGRGGT